MAFFRTSGASTLDPQWTCGVARPACLRLSDTVESDQRSNVRMFCSVVSWLRKRCLVTASRGGQRLPSSGVIRFAVHVADGWFSRGESFVQPSGVRCKHVHSRLLTVHGAFLALWGQSAQLYRQSFGILFFRDFFSGWARATIA
jgi:hypothetical protein